VLDQSNTSLVDAQVSLPALPREAPLEDTTGLLNSLPPLDAAAVGILVTVLVAHCNVRCAVFLRPPLALERADVPDVLLRCLTARELATRLLRVAVARPRDRLDGAAITSQ